MEAERITSSNHILHKNGYWMVGRSGWLVVVDGWIVDLPASAAQLQWSE